MPSASQRRRLSRVVTFPLVLGDTGSDSHACCDPSLLLQQHLINQRLQANQTSRPMGFGRPQFLRCSLWKAIRNIPFI